MWVVLSHRIGCGVYPGKFCTYVYRILERSTRRRVVVLEGIEVEDSRDNSQHVLLKRLVEREGPQTSHCVLRC